jgi:hypothetical protein
LEEQQQQSPWYRTEHWSSLWYSTSKSISSFVWRREAIPLAQHHQQQQSAWCSNSDPIGAATAVRLVQQQQSDWCSNSSPIGVATAVPWYSTSN